MGDLGSQAVRAETLGVFHHRQDARTLEAPAGLVTRGHSAFERGLALGTGFEILGFHLFPFTNAEVCRLAEARPVGLSLTAARSIPAESFAAPLNPQGAENSPIAAGRFR